MKLIVTGAAGFLGKHIVSTALARGHDVVALIRPGCSLSGLAWQGDSRVDIVQVDLATDGWALRLADKYKNSDSNNIGVIHAAAALRGDDAIHDQQTVTPTRRLLEAMRFAGWRRFVLISSFSVYGYSELAPHSQLDETSPLEPAPSLRDAYTRAKIAQEALAIVAAQSHGMLVTSLRPGMIYGSGRWWGPRLGTRLGPIGVMIGGHATLPIAHVKNCALAAVLAAEQTQLNSDMHVIPNKAGLSGAIEAINIVDDILPTQREYFTAVARVCNHFPKIVLSLPWGFLREISAAVDLATILFPKLSLQLPGILRPAALHARYKPLRFCNYRLHIRLGWSATTTWSDALAIEFGQKDLHDK